MSIRAMAAVWEAGLPANQKLVMLALADYASDEGECYPSIATLVKKTGMSERSVQRMLRELEAAGFISTSEKSEYGTHAFRLCLATLEDEPTPWSRKPPKWARRAALTVFEQRCEHCCVAGDAGHGPDGKLWELDRILPASRGGTYEPYNITLSCSTCNRKKRTTDPDHAVRSLGELLDSTDSWETWGANLAPPHGGANLTPTPRQIDTPARGANLTPKPSEEPSVKPLPARPSKAERDHFWATMVTAHGFEPVSSTERGRWGKVMKELLRLGFAAADYQQRSATYQREHPTWAFTPTAVLNHWGEVGAAVPHNRSLEHQVLGWAENAAAKFDPETFEGLLEEHYSSASAELLARARTTYQEARLAA